MSSDLDEDVRVVARGLPVEDGRLAVVVKGDGRGGVLIGGKSADASQLASLIRGRVRGNRSIRLYDAQGASEGFAQALDRALGVEVIWAPGNVFGPEANGWYLDDLLMMRPEFNVTWNTTRRDDSPPGQSPSDGPLPPAASEPRDSGMSEQVLGSGVAEIPAGIMMSPSDMDEDLRAAARHLPVEDGRLAVVVKGDGRGGILIGGESANASQLAILIRRSVYGQRSIRLYACGVSEEFAQALDEASGVEVIWTRGIVWFGPETNGFASTVSGWYLDELFMLRPDFSQGAWETTRSGEWPRGQSPSDVSLPSGLPGLSPHWVHHLKLAAPEDQAAGRSGESSAAAELSELIGNANAGLDSMREQGLPVDQLMVEVQSSMGALGGHEGLRNVMAHHILSHPGDGEGTVELNRKLRE